MLITDRTTTNRKSQSQHQATQPGDNLNMRKFNSLPGPVTARMIGGGEWWIETLDVQTGGMRIDVCGQLDFTHFSEVLELIDTDGNRHDPDDFWLDV